MAHKILVVDDQPFMVRLIQHHLERAGYELIQARNPQEAHTAMVREVPHLVLMTEKAGELRPSVLKETPGIAQAIPIIRMTDVPETMPEQNPELKDEIILRKPFSPAKLLAEVKRLLSENPPKQS